MAGKQNRAADCGLDYQKAPGFRFLYLCDPSFTLQTRVQHNFDSTAVRLSIALLCESGCPVTLCATLPFLKTDWVRGPKRKCNFLTPTLIWPRQFIGRALIARLGLIRSREDGDHLFFKDTPPSFIANANGGLRSSRKDCETHETQRRCNSKKKGLRHGQEY